MRKFTYFLKDACELDSDEHFSYKLQPKNTVVKNIRMPSVRFIYVLIHNLYLVF